jgi:hypothetical protein
VAVQAAVATVHQAVAAALAAEEEDKFHPNPNN